MGKITDYLTRTLDHMVTDPRGVIYSAGVVGLGDLVLGIQSNDITQMLTATVGGFLTFGAAMYGKMDFDEMKELDNYNHTQMDITNANNKVKA
jgi:hypothetical protein